MNDAWLLWFRAVGAKDSEWEVVAGAGTYREAVFLIGVGNRRNGEWFPLPAGKHPNQCGTPDWKIGRAGRQTRVKC